MAHQIVLPKLGVNLESAVVVSWRKKENEFVKKGEPLLEVETSKAVYEVEAEASGFVRKILAAENTEVQVNQVLGIIADKDEDIQEVLARCRTTGSPEERFVRQVEQAWSAGKAEAAPLPRRFIARFTPAARRLMHEHNLQPEEVARRFTKPVILEQDIRTFLKRRQIAIYGAGLGAKQVLEIVRQDPRLEVVGLLDDDAAKWGKERGGYPVWGGLEELAARVADGVVSGVVLSFHSEARKKVFLRIKERLPELEILPLVDPRAIICQGVRIEEGVLIEAGAVVGPDTVVGRGVIVDMGAVVSHDCFLGEFSHLSPGCHLSGVVRLEANVMVGVGAAINSTVTVGDNVLITPGSAVMNDVPKDVVVSGIPAAIIGQSRRR